MGIMIGSGIFLVAGAIALQLDSLLEVMAAWALGGLLSLCGAVSLSELGAAFPYAGGLYVYITEAYGPALGFVYGWSAMALIHGGSLATLAVAVGLYAAPLFGLSPLEQKILQVLCIVAFTAVNCFGVVLGKHVQNTLTIAKLGGLALMTAMLYWRGNMHLITANFWPAQRGLHWAAFAVALIAVLWAYDGWHFVSFAAGEIKNPTRTLPLSLVIGTTLTLAIYILANLSYYAVLPRQAIRATDRVAAAAVEHAFGQGAGAFISVLIAVSILGAINGIILGAPRIQWAMARDGLFFRSFGSVHPRYRTPVVATVAQGGCAVLFSLVGSFQQLFTSYIFASWIFYGLSVGAVIVLRKRRPELPRPYLCPLYPLTPIFFMIATLGIVIGTFTTSFRQAALGTALLLLGLPLYFVFRGLQRLEGSAVQPSS